MKGPVEFWKKHPDIEGIEVSSFGRVRSLDCVRCDENGARYKRGHCYKNITNSSGYLRVGLIINGKYTTKRVHRLVAETFIPNPNNLPQVNHKDDDRANNNVSNLEFCTASYNNQYREKFGKALGVPVLAVDLSTLEVLRFPSQHEASRTLGFSMPNINNVIRGRQKQAHGYWFVIADDKAVDITKRKLHEIGETILKVKQAENTASTDFVRQVLQTEVSA